MTLQNSISEALISFQTVSVFASYSLVTVLSISVLFVCAEIHV